MFKRFLSWIVTTLRGTPGPPETHDERDIETEEYTPVPPPVAHGGPVPKVVLCKHDPMKATDWPVGHYTCPECAATVTAGQPHPKIVQYPDGRMEYADLMGMEEI